MLSKVTPQPGPSSKCCFTSPHAQKRKLATCTKPKLIENRPKPKLFNIPMHTSDSSDYVDDTDEDKDYVPSFDVESSTTDVSKKKRRRIGRPKNKDNPKAYPPGYSYS